MEDSTLELARMPPRQAATLVLRDVLGFTADEVASMLTTTPTAIKGILQRARASLDHQLGDTGRTRPGSAEEHELGRRFAEAFVAADIDRVIALLTDDAWLSMPPAPHEYHGLAAIAEFLRAAVTYRGGRRVHLVPVRANTQPAFGSYLGEPSNPIATPGGIFVLSMAGDRISSLVRFHFDELYPRFGLAETLPVPVR
ncbi:MAG TPA: sigma factor-like helix-turn-helix DNA-binding protein [Amycolatopsis sp.]|uniref:sigma factor-like helix-turn-helix DNA-binding protein n=1 Tax=Amycolatopsis sp. TaxID=37632 RepID=UPI002B48174D|nr:sigma factor-like helix-turn-helix DNA-binding protein [Amycolatopsis sp.]HKS43872.1 sigma factor-like helix-turn-helix DNA-binding protein [Amycolatopsis sp.]